MTARIDPSIIPACPNLQFEKQLWGSSILHVAGIDEAGRGAWAGPVVAAAVILPDSPLIEKQLEGVRDSKQLSPAERSRLAGEIKNAALAWAVGFSSNVEIDACGIIHATRTAMQRAIAGLHLLPEHLLIDALFLLDNETTQTALIKGDQRSLSIAAASILAKTARDQWMIEAHQEFPVYGFSKHKGYGTRMHQKALAEYGKCSLHRCSFKPISELNQF